MSRFKEISDLGLDISRQYAASEQLKDITPLEKANIVRQKTQLEIKKPLLASSSNLLFELEKRNIPFGEIEPPLNFYSLQNRAFIYNLIPSIGNNDQIQGLSQVLENKQTDIKASGSDSEMEELEQLKTFLNLLNNLERDFSKIESARNRLQRG